MARIKIKYFGPINEGYVEGDGFLDIKKVTVFIGNQGSGKSTVAKLISTFMWLEKAMMRGDISETVTFEEFNQNLRYHNIENYLHARTELHYEGDYYTIGMNLYDINFKYPQVQFSLHGIRKERITQIPKIMYVPSERNFLSAIDGVNKIPRLLGGNLSEFAVEFRRAQVGSKGDRVELPINKMDMFYSEKDDTIYLELDGINHLRLAQAASGFHSVVPLYWVSKSLIDFIQQDTKVLEQSLSVDQKIRLDNDLKQLVENKETSIEVSNVIKRYISSFFINIVEEPEQNLFPSSQKQILYSLLGFNNMKEDNKLVLTTHSPYIINYLTLAVEAGRLFDQVHTIDHKFRLENVVPLSALIKEDDLDVYQLDEVHGIIRKLPTPEGIPSDKNFLNQSLRDGNEMFDKLLEIEQEL